MTTWNQKLSNFQSAMIACAAALACVFAQAEPIKSSGEDLGITIMGSIIQGSPDKNVALIKEETGKVKAIRKDHVVLDKYKVVAVHPKFIEVITRDAKLYHVYQDKFAAAGASTATATNAPKLNTAGEYYSEEGFERKKNDITMTAMYRDKLVKDDLAKVLMQATAEPHMVDGQIQGFKLSQIDDDSIYAKAGLRNSDVVTGINGQSLNSVAGSISLLRSLKGASSVEVEVNRNGESVTMTVSVQE